MNYPLTPYQKVLQMLYPGFRFGTDDPADAERLVELGVGGFCIYNGSIDEVYGLTQRLQAKARIPLLFNADYENGITQHVAGGTSFPSNMAIGASGHEKWAFEKARITAVESNALGVPWVFAPVVDLATQPDNPIVNVRSFGKSPALAAKMAAAYLRGLHAGKAIGCAKHFPGHGETTQDSHLKLPLLKMTPAQLAKRELIPFKKTAALADSVMMAHLYIPSLTSGDKTPTSLAPKAVALLRKGMKYDGLILTDALSMKAIADHYESEAVAGRAAIEAGCDIILVPEKPLPLALALPGLIDENPTLAPLIDAAFERLMRIKKSCGLAKTRGLVPRESLKVIGCPKHRAAAEKMAAACLAWVKKPAGPLSGRVRYLEPDASGPDEWQGREFVRELKALGIDAVPYDEKASGPAPRDGNLAARPGKEKALSGPVIVASFVRPRAYLGKIKFSDEDRKRAQAAFAKARDSFFVSFGSPYVFDQVKGYSCGLAAFSEIDASQKAAARALAGKIKATGKMPV